MQIFIKNILHQKSQAFGESIFRLNTEFLEVIVFLKAYANVWVFLKKTVSALGKSLL